MSERSSSRIKCPKTGVITNTDTAETVDAWPSSRSSHAGSNRAKMSKSDKAALREALARAQTMRATRDVSASPFGPGSVVPAAAAPRITPASTLKAAQSATSTVLEEAAATRTPCEVTVPVMFTANGTRLEAVVSNGDHRFWDAIAARQMHVDGALTRPTEGNYALQLAKAKLTNVSNGLHKDLLVTIEHAALTHNPAVNRVVLPGGKMYGAFIIPSRGAMNTSTAGLKFTSTTSRAMEKYAGVTPADAARGIVPAVQAHLEAAGASLPQEALHVVGHDATWVPRASALYKAFETASAGSNMNYTFNGQQGLLLKEATAKRIITDYAQQVHPALPVIEPAAPFKLVISTTAHGQELGPELTSASGQVSGSLSMVCHVYSTEKAKASREAEADSIKLASEAKARRDPAHLTEQFFASIRHAISP